jgi:hypothetical protein
LQSVLATIFRRALAGCIGAVLSLASQAHAESENPYDFLGRLHLSPDGGELVVRGFEPGGIFGDIVRITLGEEISASVMRVECGRLPDRAVYGPHEDHITVGMTVFPSAADGTTSQALLLGIRRDSGESMFAFSPQVEGPAFGLTFSPDRKSVYLIDNGLSQDDGVAVRRHDLDSGTSEFVYYDPMDPELIVDDIAGADDEKAYLWVYRTVDDLSRAELATLGSPLLEPQVRWRLLYETTPDTDRLELSSLYPAIRDLLAAATGSDAEWRTGFRNIGLEFRHEFGISYIALNLRGPVAGLPQFGIYMSIDGKFAPVLAFDTPIRDFSFSRDASRFAIVHGEPSPDGGYRFFPQTISILQRSEDGDWSRRTLLEEIRSVERINPCKE